MSYFNNVAVLCLHTIGRKIARVSNVIDSTDQLVHFLTGCGCSGDCDFFRSHRQPNRASIIKVLRMFDLTLKVMFFQCDGVEVIIVRKRAPSEEIDGSDEAGNKPVIRILVEILSLIHI